MRIRYRSRDCKRILHMQKWWFGSMVNNYRSSIRSQRLGRYDGWLSDEDVKDIKMMLLYSFLTQKDIAKYKGTTQPVVTQIKMGEKYAHVDID